MQAPTLTAIQKAISSQRLKSFGDPATEPEKVMARYLWNIQLSESFYPALHCLEVSLRNTVNDGACLKYGPQWLFNNAILAPREREVIESAKTRLGFAGKPVDNGRLVAELSFGFWTSLFDVRYEQKLWPSLLGSCFPNIPRSIRTRKTLSGTLNETRRLRNRVFHYEPIWHWKDLERHHARITDVLSWISPGVVSLLGQTDRFQQVYKNKPTH